MLVSSAFIYLLMFLIISKLETFDVGLSFILSFLYPKTLFIIYPELNS